MIEHARVEDCEQDPPVDVAQSGGRDLPRGEIGDRQTRRIPRQGRQVHSRQRGGHRIAHREAEVRDHEPPEAAALFDVAERGRVLAARQAVDLVIGAHHRVHVALLHRGAERRLVDLLQRPFGHGDVDTGPADERARGYLEADPAPVLVVGGVVLERRDDVLALRAADHLCRGIAGQERIFALSLRLAARQRRASDVHGRAQPLVEPFAAGLGPHHLPVGPCQRAIERRRERLPGRHRGGARVAEPIGPVVGFQHRHAEAREGGEVAQGQLDLLARAERGQQLVRADLRRLAGVSPRLPGRVSAEPRHVSPRLRGNQRAASHDDQGES